MRRVHSSAQRRYLSSCVRLYIFHNSPVQKPPVQKKPFCCCHSPVWLFPSVKNPAPAFASTEPGCSDETACSHVLAVRSISCCSSAIACAKVRVEAGCNVSGG